MFPGLDVEINVRVVGSPKPNIIPDNSFENMDQNYFVFLFLFYVIEESTRFTNANTNPTLLSAINRLIFIQSMQSFSILPNDREIVFLPLPALKDGTTPAETFDSNRRAKIASTKPAPHLQIAAIVNALTPTHD